MTWKQGFRFALAKEFLRDDGSTYFYKKGSVEAFGAAIINPLYVLLDWLSKRIRKPVVIIFMTFVALLVGIFVFYELTTFWFLAKFISLKWIRFLFFSYFEITIFAAGCRAFGRFSNADLVNEWISGKLITVFPGDRENSQ